MTIWTKLEGTPLWDAASLQYAKNGNTYHDMTHVCRLYAHAARFRLPYDLSLDRAILAHDVVLDRSGGNEARSAVWLRDHLGEEDRVATRLIMTTVDHDPQHSDRRLALLDLADFLDPERSRLNTGLLQMEAERALGDAFDEQDWVKNTVLYLDGLAERIEAGLDAGSTGAERRLWIKILRGVERVSDTLDAVATSDPELQP
jgi:predicted metal-dependent HD superfamily phosphohydrolase